MPPHNINHFPLASSVVDPDPSDHFSGPGSKLNSGRIRKILFLRSWIWIRIKWYGSVTLPTSVANSEAFGCGSGSSFSQESDFDPWSNVFWCIRSQWCRLVSEAMRIRPDFLGQYEWPSFLHKLCKTNLQWYRGTFPFLYCGRMFLRRIIFHLMSC